MSPSTAEALAAGADLVLSFLDRARVCLFRPRLRAATVGFGFDRLMTGFVSNPC